MSLRPTFDRALPRYGRQGYWGRGDVRPCAPSGRAPKMGRVTVYTQLLRDRLTGAGGVGECAIVDLLAALVARRGALAEDRAAQPGLAAALEYDAALARMCERLGIPHGLVDPFPVPGARRRAEAALAACLPGLADALG